MSTLNRIKKRKDYLAIAATGRRWVTPSFVLQVRESDNIEQGPFVGFTVTKKVGNAVIRNRVRRRLKEAAKEVFPHKATAGWEYVVIGRNACVDIAYERIKSDLKWALKKLAAKADLNSPLKNGLG